MAKHLVRTGAAALLVVVTLVAAGGRAEAAAGDPDFIGGEVVAPYTGNVAPKVSSNGTDALVVWTRVAGQGGKADVYGRLMKWDSTSLRATTFRISLQADAEYTPDVAWNGSSWLVVWEVESGNGDHLVRGRRVSADGALLGSELAIAVRAGGLQESPAVTAGPSAQFFVVWSDDRNDATTFLDIYGRRVSSAGALMDGTGTRMSGDTEASLTDDEDPAVAWNGEYFLVAWTANIYYSEFFYPEVDGLAYKPGFVSTPFSGHIGGAGESGTQGYPASAPSVAAAGKAFLVVYDYKDPTSAGVDIRATRLNGTGTQWTATEFAVSRASGDQQAPVVAFNGNFLVAWRDRRNTRSEVWGARVGSDSALQDTSGFLIAGAYPTSRLPAVAKGANGTGTFSLVFEETPAGQGAGVFGYGFQNAPK